MGLSDQELLTRLRRAATLYVDPSLRARDPYAIKSLGQHILELVGELRRRGFEITNQGSTFIAHQRDQVELIRGSRIELVDEWAMKRRVYWAISDAMHVAEKAGHCTRHVELFRALAWLYKQWKVCSVSRMSRQLHFADEPGRENKA